MTAARDAPAPRFKVLGPLEVLLAGRPVELGGRKQRTVLARLLVAAGEPVSVPRLAEDLWAGEPPAMASASLQSYVCNLRRLLEPGRRPRDKPRHLVTREVGYALLVSEADRDDEQFVGQLATADGLLGTGAAAEAADAAGAALRLWRGEPYAGVAEADWAAPAVRRLADARLDGIELHAAALVLTGRASQATVALEALVAEAPYRERGWALLMAALHLAGRTADALRAFQRVRSILADELGLDPGAAIRDVEGLILDQDDPAIRAFLLGRDARPDRTSAATSVTPPAPTTSAPTRSARVGAPVRPDEPPIGPFRRPDEQSVTPAPDGGLVGRTRELERVEAALRAVRDRGEVTFVLLTGEPGIGKTSLARQASRLAAAAGWQVGWGRCAEDGDTPAYWPLSDVIRSLPDTEPARELLAVLRGGPDDTPGRPAAVVFEALAGGLPRVVGDAPTVVVLDDVQWADPDTLAALRFLALYLPAAPLAVVATAREPFVNPALETLLAVLARTTCVRVRLGPLAADDIAALAARHGAETDPALVTAVNRRSAGNPFFATELLRLPPEQLRADALPDAVRDVIRHRLSLLPADAVSLISLTAALGEQIDFDLLCGVSGLPLDRVCELLDVAVAIGMLREVEDSLGFSHALVRDAVVSELGLLQRQRIHLRAATASAALPGRRRGELAHHLAAAGPLARATDVVAAAAAAADEATRAGGYDEAVRWRRLVADRVTGTEADPSTRSAIHRELGAALLRAGERDEGQGEIVTALDLAVSTRDPAGAARAAAALAAGSGAWPWIGYRERPERIIRALTRTAELVADRPADERAQVLAHLSLASYYVGDAPARAAELAAEAVGLIDAVEDPATMSSVLTAGCFANWRPGSEGEMAALARRMSTVAVRGGEPAAAVIAGSYLLAADLTMGATSANETLATIGEITGRAQLPAFTTVGFAWATVSLLAITGDLDGALAQLEEATRLHRRSGLYEWDASRVLSLANVALVAGRPELVASELPGPESMADGAFGVEYRALDAACRGDRDRARKLLADHPAEDWRRDWTWYGTLALRAEIVELVGAVEHAEPLERLFTPYRGLIANFGTALQCLGPVDLSLGRLALLRGEPDRAAAYLRDAVDLAGRVGSPVWLARARAYLADAVRAGGEPGRDDPDELLGLADATARDLGVRLRPAVR